MADSPFPFVLPQQMISGTRFFETNAFKRKNHLIAAISSLIEIPSFESPPSPALGSLPPPGKCITLSSCISSLKECALQNDLFKGREIHSKMIIHGFLTCPPSITSLINMYSKCFRPTDACAVFFQAHSPNLFAWNAIISTSVAHGFSSEAINLYQKMRLEEIIVPDEFTFPCVIKACLDTSNLAEGGKVHALTAKMSLEMDVFVASALVTLYLKFSLAEDARKLFDRLSVRDVVLWNALINGYAQIGDFGRALEVFGRMGEEGIRPSKFTITGLLSVHATMGNLLNGQKIHGFVEKLGHEPDVVVSNSLIDMYGKCRNSRDARKVFEEMPTRDIFSWNSILSVYQQLGEYKEALRLFDEMRIAGVGPDSITFSAVLPVCSHLAALLHGREIHGSIIVNGMNKGKDVYLENALMDMYMKCGSLGDARSLFDRMKARDVASWNIMIMGYGMHGASDEALTVFSWMCEARVNPDEVTFVGVLSACSHGGLLEEGQEILERMEQDHGIAPTMEHYACVVDMLGRAGQLSEAYELALSMPVEPNPVVWRALLAACRIHGDAGLAEKVSCRLLEVDPGHCGSYVLLSNIYGAKGSFGNVLEVREEMVQKNVRKTPGCSWIELSSGVRSFVNRDWRHPESQAIFAEVRALTGQLIDYQYAQDFGGILYL